MSKDQLSTIKHVHFILFFGRNIFFPTKPHKEEFCPTLSNAQLKDARGLVN